MYSIETPRPPQSRGGLFLEIYQWTYIIYRKLLLSIVKKCGGMSYKLMDAPTTYTSWEYYSFYFLQLPHFQCKYCGAMESQRHPLAKPQRTNCDEEKAMKERDAIERFYRETHQYIKKKNLYRSR